MKERGIIFTGESVRAILDGRKSQSRRVVNPQPEPRVDHSFRGEDGIWRFAGGPKSVSFSADERRCPYGAAGDRLWVRETWYDDMPDDEPTTRARLEDGAAEGVLYRASHDCRSFEAGCPCNPDGDAKRSEWRSPLFLPRWASRITLEVVSVRIDRLQSISEEDAKAEGVPRGCDIRDVPGGYVGPFRYRWDEINKKRAPWDSNPWVWVVAFKRSA